MNKPFEQILKQDAKAFKKQAKARLGQLDFSQKIEQQLQQKSNHRSSWVYGLAAAVCLSVISWLVWQNKTQTIASSTLIEMVSHQPIPLNIKQLPLTIEQIVNQPLIEEQQAIIQDLKSLRKSMLSI